MFCRGLLRLGRHLTRRNETLFSFCSTTAAEATKDEEDFEIKGPSNELLSSLSEEQMKQFECAKQEYQVLNYVDDQLPKEMTDEHWQKLIETTSRSLRLKYLTFLYNKERHKMKQKEKKNSVTTQDREKARMDYAERAAKGEILYKPGYNTIFTKYESQRILPICYWRMFLQSQLGAPKVVFDLSYLKSTYPQVQSLTLRQLGICYSLNRSSRLPFELLLTNVETDSKWWQTALDSHLSSLNYAKRVQPCIETLVTPQSYTELFPKEKLVYLSPDSPDTMESFDANDVYIIGGIVDKYDSGLKYQTSLAKAKEDGIRAVRLPLDKYVKWQRGNKKLSLNACLSILLKLNETNDWRRSIIESIPKRNLTQNTPQNIQRSKEFKEREQFRLSLLQDLDIN